jgi:hypothetical protein
MVKRVAAVTSGGRCFLAGDNPEESTDSRAFGAVPPELLLGRVVLRLGGTRRARPRLLVQEAP